MRRFAARTVFWTGLLAILCLLVWTRAAASASTADAAPIRCTMGFYVVSVSDLDVLNQTYRADFAMWMRCPAALPSPGGSWAFILLNGAVESRENEMRQRVGGEMYARARIRAKLRSAFNLSRYPFDRQELPIVVEHDDAPFDVLVYESDTTSDAAIRRGPSDAHQSGELVLDPDMSIPDWRIIGARQDTRAHTYYTSLGVLGAPPRLTFSRVTLRIEIERLFVPYLLKLLLPLLIITAMAYSALFIVPADIATSGTITVTALLSAIALHLSLSHNLPGTGYILAADQYFICTYLILALTLLQAILNHRLTARGMEDRARRLRRGTRVAVPLLLGVGYAAITIAALR